MTALFEFADLKSPVADDQRASVAVVGGDVASVVVAFMLATRGHQVVWYRGQEINPHPVSGVLKTYAAEPVALPGYVLSLPHLLSRNAIRGKLQGMLNWPFVGWILRAVAESRPLMAEAIAKDRASLLASAVHAFAALGQVKDVMLGTTAVHTLYPDARSYANGWAVHDVRKRNGVETQELSFDDIAAQFPHLSPQYTHGVRVADVAVVENADALLESLKTSLESMAEIVRHWPQAVKSSGRTQVEIQDGEQTRVFDWVVRGDYSGPETIWPEHTGGAPLCLPYRERHLLRDVPEDEHADYQTDQVVIDGASSAWLEHQGRKIIAAGAHTYGGSAVDDLKYLVTASYARIWRGLAGKGWHSEGGRVATSVGCLAPDSRPVLGQAGTRILEAAGFGELAWTLSAVSGFAMIAHLEGDEKAIASLSAFSPQRFL